MKLYGELASWWPLLSSPEEYEEEAAAYADLLRESAEDEPETVLELGSGGGNNASHLKSQFRMTLVDRSPGMLAVSRALNRIYLALLQCIRGKMAPQSAIGGDR